jgi:hypothetical protein
MIDVINLGQTDHVVELVSGELMLELECTFDQHGLHAIRFVTTRRVRPWLGSRKDSSLTSKAVRAPPGAHISGLFGRGADQLVTEVGVDVAFRLNSLKVARLSQSRSPKAEAAALTDGSAELGDRGYSVRSLHPTVDQSYCVFPQYHAQFPQWSDVRN